MKEFISTGLTIEQAIETALKEMGLTVEDNYEFDILEQPKKKLFGGKTDYKVRVFVEPDEKTPVAEPKAKSSFVPKKVNSASAVKAELTPKSSPSKSDVPRQEKEAKKSNARPLTASPEEVEKATEIAIDYLTKILKELDLGETSTTATKGDSEVFINITSEKKGALIGRHGSCIDSLQYLSSVVANSGCKNYVRVTLDSDGYRQKRTEALEEFARNISKKVFRTGRNQTLEPMNPNERRVIHNALQDIEGISSWSIGNGVGRRIVVGKERRR